MPIPSVLEMRVRADDVRSARKRRTGWRLAILAAVVVSTATGLVVAWVTMDDGLVLACIAIAGLFVAACLIWFAFNDSRNVRATIEPIGASEWEMRIRPCFPRDERPDIDVKRQNEGGKA